MLEAVSATLAVFLNVVVVVMTTCFLFLLKGIHTMTTLLQAVQAEIAALKIAADTANANSDVLLAQIVKLRAANGASSTDLQALVDTLVPITQSLTGVTTKDAPPTPLV